MEINGLVYKDTNTAYNLTDNGRKIAVMLIEIKTVVEQLPDL